MKRAADDAVEVRDPDVVAVPHQPTGGRPDHARDQRIGDLPATDADTAPDAADAAAAAATGVGAVVGPAAVDTGPDLVGASASPEASDGSPEHSQHGVDQLAERDVRILQFERKWWQHAGSKEQAIRDAFELSPTRYYQLVNALLDQPAALAYDPVLVKRLRRLRATRTRGRRAS